MRTLYRAFVIWNAVRTKLIWNYYRLLSLIKDETVVKYSVLAEKNKNLFASKYMLYLPKEEELIRLIDEDRERFALGADTEADDEE